MIFVIFEFVKQNEVYFVSSKFLIRTVSPGLLDISNDITSSTLISFLFNNCIIYFLYIVMTNELVGLLFITIVSMYEHIYQLGEYIYYG